MKMFTGFRRAGVAAATGLLAMTLASAGAAQEFPSRPVRLVIGFAPGGIADISSRLLAHALAEKMGQPFIIDNRPGAGGIVSAEQVAKAAPDGYNLLLMTNGNAAAVTLMKSLPYDPVKDFAMISPYSTFDLVIVTGRESKIITLKDLLNAARSNPQKFNLGSINIGSTQHLSMELFRAQAGIEMNAVTYKGTPALIAALQGNEVQVGFEVLGPVLSQITGGTLRAVAVTGPRRFDGLPNVPTVVESGMPQYSVSSWNGIAGPAKLPRPLVQRLNSEIGAVLARPDIRQKMSELGLAPNPGSPEDLQKLLVSEIRRWGEVVRQAKIEPQ